MANPHSPHPHNTSIVDLLKAGGASAAAIQQLTPAASKLTKGHLIHLWLNKDTDAQSGIGVHGTGHLPPPGQLSTADTNSIMRAFANAYNSSAGLAPPQGFFCSWSCCCCTPCCCCAVAVAQPVKRPV
jgi:hypothetical protein